MVAPTPENNLLVPKIHDPIFYPLSAVISKQATRVTASRPRRCLRCQALRPIVWFQVGPALNLGLLFREESAMKRLGVMVVSACIALSTAVFSQTKMSNVNIEKSSAAPKSVTSAAIARGVGGSASAEPARVVPGVTRGQQGKPGEELRWYLQPPATTGAQARKDELHPPSAANSCRELLCAGGESRTSAKDNFGSGTRGGTRQPDSPMESAAIDEESEACRPRCPCHASGVFGS